MKTFAIVAALGSSVFMLGCDDGTAVPSPLEPQLAVAGASGCYTVQFTVEITTPDEVVFEATMSGDLEGTIDLVGTGFTWPPTGATNTSTFEYTWHVTGGAVPELIGETFVTHAENRNILYFLLPPGQLFVRNVGNHRSVAGVERANLTYTGETNVDSPPFVTRLDHRGVICP
jgi:hypothetical protein